MGGLAMLLLSKFGWSLDLLFYGTLAAVLLSISVIDIASFRIPNPITLTGAILAVLMTIAFRRDHLLMTLLGGFTGLGALLFMWLIGSLLFRKETLGMGDIKLAGMMGLYLGPALTVGMFLIGVFLGALIGGALVVAGGKGWGQKIPFGPYLAAGAITALLWGSQLWNWYLGLVIR